MRRKRKRCGLQAWCVGRCQSAGCACALRVVRLVCLADPGCRPALPCRAMNKHKHRKRRKLNRMSSRK